MMKKIIFPFLFLIPFLMHAQSESPVFAGNVKSVKQIDHGIAVKTENAYVQILVFSPTVIRIRVSRLELKEDF